QLDGMECRPSMHEHLIEAKVRCFFPGALQHAFEHQVIRHPVLAPGHIGQAAAKLFRSEVSQKPKFAEVDAQHGYLAIAHLSRCPQNGPVAAQNERQIGCQRAQVFFLLQIEGTNLRMLADQGKETLRFFDHAGAVSIAEYENAHAVRSANKDSRNVWPDRNVRPTREILCGADIPLRPTTPAASSNS